MTQTSTAADSSDADLISAVRTGDIDAYGQLFDRHRDAALRLSRQLVRGPDAQDLVSESFMRVLTVLQDGRGPDESFRAYLLTSIRRLHIDRIRAAKRVRSTDDEAELDRAVEFVDPTEMTFERSAAATAFSSLPERWQLVLWHLDVEGQKPAEIAPLLGMSANSVSALAYRAREGLRQAYLQGHLAPALHEGCRATTGQLGPYVRKGLSARDVAKVEAHLDDCSRCTGLSLELAEVNSNLSGLLAPVVLGTAAAGYLTGTGAAAVGLGVGAAAGAKGLVAHALEIALAPIKLAGAGVASAGVQGVVAIAVVAGVATAGTLAVTTDFGTSADRQRAIRHAATPSSTTPSSTTPSSTTPLRHSRSTTAPTAPTRARPTTPTLTTPVPVVPLVAPSTADPTGPPPTGAQPAEPGAVPSGSAPSGSAPSGSAPSGSAPSGSAPSEEPIVPTDYGVGAVVITNDESLLQRRFTISITAANDGRAGKQPVTVRMDFRATVMFRGVVSPGWDCGAASRDRPLAVLSCSSTLPAGSGTTFIAKVRGLQPSGSVTVVGKGDPRPDNDSTVFRSGFWLPL
ncbi:sigma-70 family RNA polymerase sigma factor [Aeromicrobium sp.]|uniref:sigma-70 family RNA polymerase sigma factor n=1 Tax=Aeromicrobium sp. TaxID=1871063 RepID=UPI001990B092|nr:sigma-70 family RNA polymerase sigma factor [Aeromicrobium sp.]MBC7629931.1 sigma-70 family RNA polymerase sigma factor [Aeromicrobium sp.]